MSFRCVLTTYTGQSTAESKWSCCCGVGHDHDYSGIDPVLKRLFWCQKLVLLVVVLVLYLKVGRRRWSDRGHEGLWLHRGHEGLLHFEWWVGGWVAIVSDRKSRIAHFEFACAILDSACSWTTVWYVIDHHTQTFREVRLTIMADCQSRSGYIDRSWLKTWFSRRRPVRKWQLDLFSESPFYGNVLYLRISEERKQEVHKCVPHINRGNGRYRAANLMPHPHPKSSVRPVCWIEDFLNTQSTENHFQINVRLSNRGGG